MLIFNRPETTARVFEAVRAAKPPKLLLVADGPRVGKIGEKEKCRAARSIVQHVDWPCTVLTSFSDENLGCKLRISTGLDWVFSQVDEAIILEDDCLPHPSFFRFCEEMLARYRDDERVMMIAGTNYLIDKLLIKESYCFSRYYSIWGWASWKRAWSKYDINMSEWETLRSQDQLKSLYSEKFMCNYISKMFDSAFENRINTWDIQWFYSCLINNGLCIVPRVNLVSNIGIEGTHSSKVSSNHNFAVFDIDLDNLSHPQSVIPNRLYDGQFFSMHFEKTLITKLARLVRKWNEKLKSLKFLTDTKVVSSAK
jgi:hypothetical protein